MTASAFVLTIAAAAVGATLAQLGRFYLLRFTFWRMGRRLARDMRRHPAPAAGVPVLDDPISAAAAAARDDSKIEGGP